MSHGRVKILSFTLIFHFCNSYGQNSNIGNWFIYFGNQKISKTFNWHNEVQYRNYNIAGDLEQLLLRTGIGADINTSNNVLMGYGYIRSENYIKGTNDKVEVNEHRPFQQYIHKSKFKRLLIQNRIRVEERFIGSDFKLRFRHFLLLNLPINKPVMEKNAVYLSAYNELFLHPYGNNFDRNRVYGALGWVLNKDIKFEIGLMSQIFQNSSRTQFQIVMYNNIPFMKQS
jgi:hypothetical protein